VTLLPARAQAGAQLCAAAWGAVTARFGPASEPLEPASEPLEPASRERPGAHAEAGPRVAAAHAAALDEQLETLLRPRPPRAPRAPAPPRPALPRRAARAAANHPEAGLTAPAPAQPRGGVCAHCLPRAAPARCRPPACPPAPPSLRAAAGPARPRPRRVGCFGPEAGLDRTDRPIY
jgi:hypothetical protein